MNNLDNTNNRGKPVDLRAKLSQTTNYQMDHFDSTLRTYASWLVRVIRRRLGDYSPNNSDIDLTSAVNKCSNPLIDNGINDDEGTAK